VRNQVHDGHIVFRANTAIISALGESARASGYSVRVSPRHCPRKSRAFVSAARLTQAASGDIDAQRELANLNYSGRYDPGAFTSVCYTEAIVWQRMVAARGTLEDRRALVYLLAEYSGWLSVDEQAASNHFMAQAVMLAEALAEDGDELAAGWVASAADNISADVFLRARHMREVLAA